ncbi:hypothetical protein AB0P04_43015, partial [Streptomyces anulatus]
MATFGGRTIRLDQGGGGWSGARVCVVSKALPTTACFGAEAEADAFRRTVSPDGSGGADQAAAPLFCPNPLHLYEHINGGGRHLQFCDTGYWQDLSPYGFDNQTSSYRTGTSSAHLGENPGGTGYWYPGDTG